MFMYRVKRKHMFEGQALGEDGVAKAVTWMRLPWEELQRFGEKGHQAGNPQHIGTSEVDEGGGAAVEVWEDPGGWHRWGPGKRRSEGKGHCFH